VKNSAEDLRGREVGKNWVGQFIIVTLQTVAFRLFTVNWQ